MPEDQFNIASTNHVYSLEMLHLFQTTSYATVGAPTIKDILHTRGLALAQDSPVVLYSILAFAAKHLEYLRPNDHQAQVAAIQYANWAIQLYSRQLNSPIDRYNVDSLISACMMLTALAFWTEASSPSQSWVFAPGSEKENWLGILSGLKTLSQLESVRQQAPYSVFLPVLLCCEAFKECVLDTRLGTDGLPPLFAELCGIDETSTPANNEYFAALRTALAMTHLEQCPQTFQYLAVFPCTLRPEFTRRLSNKDPTALLIMGYWFARLCSLENWWCKNRARKECVAICTHLDGSPDERIQKLLRYPMDACGYVPIDLQMIDAYVFGM